MGKACLFPASFSAGFLGDRGDLDDLPSGRALEGHGQAASQPGETRGKTRQNTGTPWEKQENAWTNLWKNGKPMERPMKKLEHV